MAQIVIGIGTSHSPLCATEAPMWEQRAISDHSNPELYDLNGNKIENPVITPDSGFAYQTSAQVESVP